jgi:hypothetical protein
MSGNLQEIEKNPYLERNKPIFHLVISIVFSMYSIGIYSFNCRNLSTGTAREAAQEIQSRAGNQFINQSK